MTTLIKISPLELAESLAPILRATAQESESLGRLAPRASAALRDSGLYGLLIAPELGGQGADVLTFIDVIEESSRHDTSAGWCLMVATQTAAAFSASIGDEAAKTFFLGEEPFIPAGQLAPMGTARAVPGGYLVQGKYQFGSGMYEATWACGGAWLEKPGGERLSLVYAVPRERAEILGNWDVLGLKGTGSVDYAISETFVPEDGVFLRIGAPILRGQPSLQFGAFLLGTAGHTSVALGTAKRAIEELAVLGSAIPPAGRDRFLYDFAELEGQYQAARRAFVSITAEYQAIAETGSGFTKSQINAYRQAGVLTVNECLQVVLGAFLRAGSNGFREPAPLGKYMRDMLVECQHALINMRILSELGDTVLTEYILAEHAADRP